MSDDAVTTSFRSSLMGAGEKSASSKTPLNVNNNSDEVHHGNSAKSDETALRETTDTLDRIQPSPSMPHTDKTHSYEKPDITPKLHSHTPPKPHSREVNDAVASGNENVIETRTKDEVVATDTDGDGESLDVKSVSDSTVENTVPTHHFIDDVNNNNVINTSNVEDDDTTEQQYKSRFALTWESELYQQQLLRSPRSMRSELNMSGNKFKQITNLIKAGKHPEIPQTQEQYTREVSSSRTGINSSMSQANTRTLNTTDVSPRRVDGMQKYRPAENPPGTLYPRAPSPQSAQRSPRQTSNSRMSKIVLGPRDFDLTENLYPERMISPKSTQRYIQVSRLPLQMRGSGGDRSPPHLELSASGNYGYPSSPPGSPGCDGIPGYRIVKQTPSEGMDKTALMGQSYGEPYVSPARKRLEVIRFIFRSVCTLFLNQS